MNIPIFFALAIALGVIIVIFIRVETALHEMRQIKEKLDTYLPFSYATLAAHLAERLNRNFDHRLDEIARQVTNKFMPETWRGYTPPTYSQMKNILLDALKEYDQAKIPKEVTLEDVEKKFGHKVKVVA